MKPLTEAIVHADELRQKLRRMRWRDTPAGCLYRGPADFVLRHGTPYEWRPLPENVRPGAPRACFGNAIALAHDAQVRGTGLHYVEGFALDPGRTRLPILHAWLVDDEGKVVDPTWWRYPTDAYLGVIFSTARADDATWNGDACVLDDWMRGWPLFRQPWTGENPHAEWPDSPRLEMIRRKAMGETIDRNEYERTFDVNSDS